MNGTTTLRSLSVAQTFVPLASDMIYISVSPKLRESSSVSIQLWAECKCAFDTYLNRCHNSFSGILNLPCHLAPLLFSCLKTEHISLYWCVCPLIHNSSLNNLFSCLCAWLYLFLGGCSNMWIEKEKGSFLWCWVKSHAVWQEHRAWDTSFFFFSFVFFSSLGSWRRLM